jgi:uncharacterized protein YjgD (DUF1641 family)
MVTTFTTSSYSASEQLAARLNERSTAEAINSILDNIELIAFSVKAVDGFLRRSEAVAENVAESVAEMKGAVPNSVNLLVLLPRILEMLPQMLDLVERLTQLSKTPEFQRLLDIFSNPTTLNAITSIMSNIELLSMMVNSLDSFLRRSETIMDNVASSISDVTKGAPAADFAQTVEMLPKLLQVLPRLVDTVPQLIEVGERLQPLLDSPEFDALTRSGIFAPKTVMVVGRAGDALVSSYDQHHQNPKSVGLFGLLGVLRDPDVQRALGFAAQFGKQFGKKIE